jgi:hypothetical protein
MESFPPGGGSVFGYLMSRVQFYYTGKCGETSVESRNWDREKKRKPQRSRGTEKYL